MDYTKDQIEHILRQVALKWDERKFDEARVYFNDIVEIDYTSLGAPAVTMDQLDQLCQNWKIVLNGFDKTTHTVKVEAIEQVGENLRVISKVSAYHFIADIQEGCEWILEGQYTHQLKKIDGQLKIVGMKLEVFEQKGNLKLIQDATKRTMK